MKHFSFKMNSEKEIKTEENFESPTLFEFDENLDNRYSSVASWVEVGNLL